jgi:hypothetical protein
MIDIEFFRNCGLICLNEEDAKRGFEEFYRWTFPGLEYDWVIKSARSNTILMTTEFLIISHEIKTASLKDYSCKTTEDLNELRNIIFKMNQRYKQIRERLLLEAIRDDFH